MPTTELQRTAEVAAEFRVHPRTVIRLAEQGELRATQVGRRLRFRRSDVEDYLAQKSFGLGAVVDRIVADAAGLTDEQRARLAAVLEPRQ